LSHPRVILFVLPVDDRHHQAKSALKGQRLIILHDISVKGPLYYERVEGIPVDALDWKGDTPHPGTREDGKVTCETLWLANSKAGDYHDNMTFDMFMQWVEKKLLDSNI
jgi:hypothetical protein